jgi:hypothetical protein
MPAEAEPVRLSRRLRSGPGATTRHGDGEDADIDAHVAPTWALLGMPTYRVRCVGMGYSEGRAAFVRRLRGRGFFASGAFARSRVRRNM